MDAIVHYDSQTEQDIFVQFDDDEDTMIQFTEGTGLKIRRYVIDRQDIIDSGLPAGKYTATIRYGDIDPDYGDDVSDVPPFEAFDFIWNGEKEITFKSGGGVLSARVGSNSLGFDSDYLFIIQGEEKVITFIIEADGRFDTASFEEIVVRIADPADHLVIINNDDIERLAESLDIQVIRATLPVSGSNTLIEGIARIEISLDSQKVQLTQAIKISEALPES